MAGKLQIESSYEPLEAELRRHVRSESNRAFSRRADKDAALLDADLLTWSRHFLPVHFRLPPSAMHVWLAQQLDAMRRNPLPLGEGRVRVLDAPVTQHPHPDPLPKGEGETHPHPGPLPWGEGGGKLNVVGPRGSAKSTVVTLAYVLREALAGNEPYIWIVSDTRHQAAAHLDNVKAELVENRLLLRAYPQAAGVGPVWRRGAIVLRNGAMIEAFGTGQRVRGRRRKQHRPTLIVCDDLQNDGHICSALAREHSRTWFHGLLMKAGTKRTNVVNLGTALHRECLSIELHRTPGWTSRVFRAIERWPDHMPLWHAWEEMYCDTEEFGVQGSGFRKNSSERSSPSILNPEPRRLNPQSAAREFYERHRELMHAGAVLLWPEAEDLYTLMCMRAESGRTAFEREKQSTPVNPELCEWPDAYFGDWIWFDTWPASSGQWSVAGGQCAEGGRPDIGFGVQGSGFRKDGSERSSPSMLNPEPRTLNPRLVLKVLALDPSKGADARRGDYSAFVMLGVGSDGVLYVEADLARRPTPQIVTDGVELCRRFRPHALGIEANQFQELLGADFAEELLRQGLIGIAPCSITNHVSKAVRIRRLGPLLAARRMRFKTNSPGTHMLVEQLKEFPIADHDDGPDAAEMALRLAESYLQPNVDDGLGDRLI